MLLPVVNSIVFSETFKGFQWIIVILEDSQWVFGEGLECSGWTFGVCCRMKEKKGNVKVRCFVYITILVCKLEWCSTFYFTSQDEN